MSRTNAVCPGCVYVEKSSNEWRCAAYDEVLNGDSYCNLRPTVECCRNAMRHAAILSRLDLMDAYEQAELMAQSTDISSDPLGAHL